MYNFLAGVLIGLIIGIATVAIRDEHNAEATLPYRQGQIDALTGKVKYHLVEKENKEKVWEEIVK
jgi:hypothetical protein